MDNYYVYMYLDKDNVPFYIGKGTGIRYKPERHLNNNHHYIEHKIKKLGIDNIKIHFLHENLSEQEAMSWERYWIKYIGRKNIGEGSLCNLTDGGEGSSGVIQSEETKNKRSVSMKKLVKDGKVFTEEHRKRISEGKQGQFHTIEAKKKMSDNHSIGKAAKLTKKDVIIIISKYDSGVSTNQIANEYNISVRYLYNILNGYAWKSITYNRRKN